MSIDRSGSLRAMGVAGAYLLHSPDNIYYITGFWGDDTQVLVKAAKTILFTDSRYTEQAKRDVNTETVQIVETNGEQRLPAIRTALGDFSGPLAIEKGWLDVLHFEELQGVLGSLEEYPDVSGPLEELRCYKTDDELERIKDAARGTQEVLQAVASKIHAGKREDEIRADILYETAKRGMDTAFEPIVAAGPNGALPHARPSAYALKVGDLLTIDLGCKRRGYCADMTRTFGIGHVDGQLRTIYDIVREAQSRALGAADIGIEARRVDEAARQYIHDKGYGENFGHGTGHGVGLQVHELPRINRTSDAVIEEGMVFTIEPGIYVPGLGGARIEDTCIAGFGSLFDFTKELIEL